MVVQYGLYFLKIIKLQLVKKMNICTLVLYGASLIPWEKRESGTINRTILQKSDQILFLTEQMFDWVLEIIGKGMEVAWATACLARPIVAMENTSFAGVPKMCTVYPAVNF